MNGKDLKVTPKKNPAAVALGKLGGQDGGKYVLRPCLRRNAQSLRPRGARLVVVRVREAQQQA